MDSTARKAFVAGTILAVCLIQASAQTHKKVHHAAKSHAIPSAKRTSKSHRAKSHKPVRRRHGQESIDAGRARLIQEALIREKYLSGEPTGVWDLSTQEAMARYQADNGWQTKVTPDSRALIKLGLGPDHSGQEMMQTLPKSPSSAATANDINK